MTIYLIGFAFGFTACWFAKDKIKLGVMGAKAEIIALEVKLATLKAKL